MSGGDGADWIEGGLGDDRLSGDEGNDRLFGNGGMEDRLQHQVPQLLLEVLR